MPLVPAGILEGLGVGEALIKRGAQVMKLRMFPLQAPPIEYLAHRGVVRI